MCMCVCVWRNQCKYTRIYSNKIYIYMWNTIRLNLKNKLNECSFQFNVKKKIIRSSEKWNQWCVIETKIPRTIGNKKNGSSFVSLYWSDSGWMDIIYIFLQSKISFFFHLNLFFLYGKIKIEFHSGIGWLMSFFSICCCCCCCCYVHW